jgi:hypothetical protein
MLNYFSFFLGEVLQIKFFIVLLHHDLQTQTINGTSRPYRLAVRTSPFHGLNGGSIPPRVTNRCDEKIVNA